MITNFTRLPSILTRRRFNTLLGAATGKAILERNAKAAGGAPFTVAVIPDPQYLAGDSTCGGSTLYNGLINWAITNRNLNVVGYDSNTYPLNIKGFIQVGDCVNTSTSASLNAQQTIAINACAAADGVGGSATASPKMFMIRCCGNHDYDAGASVDRSLIGYMWRDDKSGVWSPTSIAAGYSGGMDLGNGDYCFYGGSYNDGTYPIASINTYYRLFLQGRKILITSLEFFPRAEILNWAEGLAAAWPDHDWWITTHGYQDSSGALCGRGFFGPDGYSLGAAPASFSGSEMWNGASGYTSGLKANPNLSVVTCGHWIDGWNTGAGYWIWKKLSTSSTSSRAQTVHQIIANAQGSGSTGDLAASCGGSLAHIMLLRIYPSTSKLEAFMLSTVLNVAGTNGWIGASGVTNQAAAVNLFNVDLPVLNKYVYPPFTPIGR